MGSLQREKSRSEVKEASSESSFYEELESSESIELLCLWECTIIVRYPQKSFLHCWLGNLAITWEKNFVMKFWICPLKFLCTFLLPGASFLTYDIKRDLKNSDIRRKQVLLKRKLYFSFESINSKFRDPVPPFAGNFSSSSLAGSLLEFISSSISSRMFSGTVFLVSPIPTVSLGVPWWWRVPVAI